MKTVHQLLFSTVVIASLLLSSCSSMERLRPLGSGEARLKSIQMPEYVREELPYDVIISFESDTIPQIRNVCFRWVAEELSTRSPELYNYSMSNDFNASGSQGNWLNQGVSIASNHFCVDSSQIRADVPGQLIVRIRPANLSLNYNLLEARVEYLSEGRLRTSNAVSTHVVVEK
ncbi:MAG: hypothetical protein LLG06_16695 [Desulfobacteraceae bacterium]|nr:hypothetical protein [Desulfobacteraceae bacterium]